jgi:HAD superfamily hydrolase (TIGR01549 family)
VVVSGRYKVLSLDLGETTIWDTKKIGSAGYRMRVSTLAREFIGRDGRPIPSERVVQVRDDLIAQWRTEGRLPRCFTIRYQIQEIQARLQAQLARPIEELAEEYSRAGLWEHPPHINPEAQVLVQELNAAGFPVIAISNTSRSGHTWESFFRDLGRMRFDHVASSTDLGICKPDSRIFLEAAHVIGVEPSSILHVGDRLNIDVEGAMRSGMGAALYRGLWPHYYDMTEGDAVMPPKGSSVPCFENLLDVRHLLDLPIEPRNGARKDRDRL